ncbi:hypothetical protein BOTBODRAFT_179497 [Botryobasidium botryosum FD-172 SS1]|uniref:Thioredoxin-like fold domain-containing protein n=1 Tax=Botryobasidium botryosum (strain FD-172 SS1) TaxID=930990 RepID=A0A067MAK8_BOTB1|nr:hypothetical protein BOTBODRAFT_179497 [Botryobasidium botryosum FD-172 SS1]
MKVAGGFVALLACCSATHAAYFSEGWKPGQPVTKATQLAATATTTNAPAATLQNSFQQPLQQPEEKQSGEGGFIKGILTSGPLATALSKAGIDMARVETILNTPEAEKRGWDPRVQMITDENYEDVIVNEVFESAAEEKERVWFLDITIGSEHSLSAYVDSQYDEAYNMTQIAQDLPHVRWGRIDYLAVTAITTQWLVWHAPTLVVLHERGKVLRFYRPRNIRMEAEVLREFLKEEGWRETEPWASVWSPQGSRAEIMRQFSIYFAKFYYYLSRAPRWLILVISGSIASTVLQYMHGNGGNQEPARPKPRRVLRPPPAGSAVTRAANADTEGTPVSEGDASQKATENAISSPSKVKKRKGGKKA